LHRSVKDADLSFEDEKFSYVALSRKPSTSLVPARVIARPVQGSGHVHLDVCTPQGLARRTYSKRQGAMYKAAKRANWGDAAPD
jgi:ribosomal protein RSM22 (predicted rRNA methylase)